MDLETKELQDKVVKEILSMEERTLLKQAEDKMLHNEETLKLINCFQETEENYNFYLKSFGENHEFTIKAKKALFEAKLNMDNNLLVKEYNGLLNKVNEPLRYLTFNLINRFSRSKGEKKC